MTNNIQKNASPLWVVIAFATVYIVWGSTYFFIEIAVKGMPPMLMGALRFTTAGILMLGWCIYKGDKIWVKQNVIKSAIVGLLLLFVGTGVCIWVERTLPSALVAIMVSASPIWVVMLDKAHWHDNFRSRHTIIGLVVGFGGILLLFGEQLLKAIQGPGAAANVLGMILLLCGSMAWAAGSLFSKYKGSSSPGRVNTAWQMLAAGVAFVPAALMHHEFGGFNWSNVPAQCWLAVLYLILFGSIVTLSAYTWLLQVRSAAEVSTHAYVNPVIAVILGLLFAGEHISVLQITGLVIILGSVLLINLAKYRKNKRTERPAKAFKLIEEAGISELSFSEQADM